jgi:hypothetical protein
MAMVPSATEVLEAWLAGVAWISSQSRCAPAARLIALAVIDHLLFGKTLPDQAGQGVHRSAQQGAGFFTDANRRGHMVKMVMADCYQVGLFHLVIPKSRSRIAVFFGPGIEKHQLAISSGELA